MRSQSAKSLKQSDMRTYKDVRQETEERMIRDTLKQLNGNITHAATALGMSRVHLHRLIRDYGLQGYAKRLRK